MDKKERINKFSNEIYQMAEDNDFTTWDLYSVLQGMYYEVSRIVRRHHSKECVEFGAEKWKAEYVRK